MDVRNSFSRLKKKVKRIGGKRKPDRTEAGVDGKSVDSANSLARPEHHVVAGDGEGNAANADGQHACSMDRPLQPGEPELEPASGVENGQGAGEADFDGGEVSTVYSHLHPDAEAGAGSGPSQGENGVDEAGDEQFYSCSSTPSTPRSGEPDGM